MLYLKKVVAFSTSFIFMFFLLLPQTSYASDIDNHWAKEEMQELVDKNIMAGFGNDVYLPNKLITRAEFTKLILAALDIEPVHYANPFQDVRENAWYYRSVVTAAKSNLITGTSPTTFAPDQLITRQSIATIMMRVLSMKGIDTVESSTPFADEQTISPFAKSSVKKIQQLGIVTGIANGSTNNYDFKPLKNATRAEAAVMLVRMLKVIEQPEQPEQPTQPVEPDEIIRTVTYNYDFKEMVDKQMAITGTARPKTDIAGTWYEGSRNMVAYYANPNNFSHTETSMYQFLILSGNAGLTKTELNGVLADGGVLKNKGDAFSNASRTHGVNEIYLIAHSYLETGRGTSSLATGKLQVGINEAGNAVMVTNDNKNKLKEIKPIFNLFGIRANDSCPQTCGSIYAYQQGWFTVDAAINGGAKFIAGNYFTRGQDTLYKMRWNPNSPASYQYATDVAWAAKQTSRMSDMLHELYGKSTNVTKTFELPKFNNTPASSTLPRGEDIFRIDTLHPSVGKKAMTTATIGVNFRTVPTTSPAFGETIIKKLPVDTEVLILAENTNWFKVKADNQEGWISGDYLNIPDVKGAYTLSQVKENHVVNTTEETINGTVVEDEITLKQEPNESSPTLEALSIGTKIEILEEVDGWVNVNFNNQSGWIPVGSITITDLAESN